MKVDEEKLGNLMKRRAVRERFLQRNHWRSLYFLAPYFLS